MSEVMPKLSLSRGGAGEVALAPPGPFHARSFGLYMSDMASMASDWNGSTRTMFWSGHVLNTRLRCSGRRPVPGGVPVEQQGRLPAHVLRLKVGAPIITLRNITKGVSNGTRMVVTRLLRNSIFARVLHGPMKGQEVAITTHNMGAFELQRRQLPIRVAFAMTTGVAPRHRRGQGDAAVDRGQEQQAQGL